MIHAPLLDNFGWDVQKKAHNNANTQGYGLQ